MLYDFRHGQNSTKTKSVHATFTIEGIPKTMKEASINGFQRDGEDVHMRSSPYMSSSVPQEDGEVDLVLRRQVTLAREEDLEGNRASWPTKPRITYECDVSQWLRTSSSSSIQYTYTLWSQIPSRFASSASIQILYELRRLTSQESASSFRLQSHDIETICERGPPRFQ